MKPFLSLMQKINRLILSTLYKTKLKQFKKCKDREVHTECLYCSLNTWATSSPQKPLRIHYVINPRLQATHTKSDDLEPLKNTYHSLTSYTHSQNNPLTLQIHRLQVFKLKNNYKRTWNRLHLITGNHSCS